RAGGLELCLHHFWLITNWAREQVGTEDLLEPLTGSAAPPRATWASCTTSYSPRSSPPRSKSHYRGPGAAAGRLSRPSARRATRHRVRWISAEGHREVACSWGSNEQGGKERKRSLPPCCWPEPFAEFRAFSGSYLTEWPH